MNNDKDQKTGSDNPGSTGQDDQQKDQKPATNQDKGNDSAKDGDDIVKLSKKDYNNLISQRDRNHTDAQKNQEKYSDLEDIVNEIARERAINSFLKDNKKDYPDVQIDDLLHVTPDTLESEAKRIQRRYQEVTQERLKDVQRSGAPQMSAEDKAARLNKLKSNPGSQSFDEMVNLRTS